MISLIKSKRKFNTKKKFEVRSQKKLLKKNKVKIYNIYQFALDIK